MAIHHVAIVSLPVTDQDRSIAFFKDKLGFEVRRDASMGANKGRWAEIAPQGAETALTLVTWFEQILHRERPGRQRVGNRAGAGSVRLIVIIYRPGGAELQARGSIEKNPGFSPGTCRISPASEEQ